MTVSAAFSSLLLQVAGETVPSVPPAPEAAPDVYDAQFLLHAAFIWIALIIIGLIVFAYRKMRRTEKSNFPQVYQRELEAMRHPGHKE